MNKLFLIIFIIIGLLIRFFFVSFSPFAIINEDSSTIGLMARHILQGDIPLFFYGQYYQAPIEPIFVALFFFIFGINSVTLSITPIFFTTLLLIVTYLLGKELKNHTVGFWAMMYFLLPPYYLFHDSFTPLGYHIELLLIGEIILVLTLKISKAQKKAVFYILLGVVGGIGFWMSYLLIYFLMASGIYLFFTEKKISFIKNGIPFVCSFFLAGLPYWIFGIKHSFITFKFPGGGDTNSLEILKKFFIFDIPGLIGRSTGQWIYLLAIIIFIFYTIRARDKRLWLLWFLLFSILILYTKGRYHAMSATYHYRYTSSMYVFIALMLGCFVWLLNKKTSFLGTLIMALLLGIHGLGIYRNLEIEKGRSKIVREEYENLSEFLLENGITRIIGPDRSFRPLMFLSNERFICQEYMGSGYLGYDDMVERSPGVAFFNDIDFSSSLSSLCQGFKKERGFYYDFSPYPYSYKEIPSYSWRASSRDNLRSTKYAFDRNYDTYWCSKRPKSPGMYFYLDLGKIYNIAKIQLFYANHYKNLPRMCRVEVSADNKNWGLVCIVENPQPFFWSGPRIYWHLQEGRWEIIFTPRDARYIRFIEMGKEERNPWEINELFVYEYLGGADYKDDLKGLKQAYAFLRGKGADFIYADYWESAKIRQCGGRALRPFNPLYFWLPSMSRLVEWDENTAFIIKDENVVGWERLLKEFSIIMNKKQFGRYYCYYFENLDKSYRDFKNIYWIGISGVKVDLEERHPPPKNKISIEFKNGIKFLGYTINNKRIFLGKEILIDYFWEVRKEPKRNLAVFVHFVKDGEIVFQNDHDFIFQLGRDMFRGRLRLKIPEDIPIGRYNIIIGLWDKDSGRRVKIKGLDKKSVEIGVLEIPPIYP